MEHIKPPTQPEIEQPLANVVETQNRNIEQPVDEVTKDIVPSPSVQPAEPIEVASELNQPAVESTATSQNITIDPNNEGSPYLLEKTLFGEAE